MHRMGLYDLVYRGVRARVYGSAHQHGKKLDLTGQNRCLGCAIIQPGYPERLRLGPWGLSKSTAIIG